MNLFVFVCCAGCARNLRIFVLQTLKRVQGDMFECFKKRGALIRGMCLYHAFIFAGPHPKSAMIVKKTGA